MHVVCFKFRDEGDVERVAGLLEALPAKIPEIRRYDVGRDFVRSERSYDLALVAEFASHDDLDTYRDHPDHVAVATQIRSLTTHAVVVDYTRP